MLPTLRAGRIRCRFRGLVGWSLRICGGLLWLFALRTFTVIGLLLRGLLRVLPLRRLSSLVGFRYLNDQLSVTFFYYAALINKRRIVHYLQWGHRYQNIGSQSSNILHAFPLFIRVSLIQSGELTQLLKFCRVFSNARTSLVEPQEL